MLYLFGWENFPLFPSYYTKIFLISSTQYGICHLFLFIPGNILRNIYLEKGKCAEFSGSIWYSMSKSKLEVCPDIIIVVTFEIVFSMLLAVSFWLYSRGGGAEIPCMCMCKF